MEAILQWDGQALLFIQEHIRQVWMDGFWKTITHLGCRMVLDYLGNRTSDSEKDKKSRNCRFGGTGDRSIDHKCGTQKHHCKNPPV